MKRLLQLVIRGYQVCVSPLLHALGGAGCGCRFEPSCSQYALEAVGRHGSWRGLWLGVRRLLRCHPWGPSGPDPVPAVVETRRPSNWAKPGH